MTTITLSIVRSPDSTQVQPHQARGPEVTVGRGANCDWILPDPQRSLSRLHCRLELLAGDWQVRDLSAYGTFLNADADPIGRECLRPLRQGDRLRLGDYEVEISLMPEAAVDHRSPFGQPDRLGENTPVRGFAGVRLPGLDDPISPLGMDRPMVGRPIAADASPFGAMSDHSPATSDAFTPPHSIPSAGDASSAPDDWFRSMLMPSTKRAAPQAAPVAARSFEPPASAMDGPLPQAAPDPMPDWEAPVPASEVSRPMDAPQQRMAAPPVVQALSGSTLPGLLLLLEAAGLAADRLPRAAQDPDKVLRHAGAVLQASVAGLRALLIARNLVKREFRIEQTILSSKDNNPLKFAASDEVALAALLDDRTEGLQVVQQAIDDLTEHEVAVMSSTQAAARAMLERLLPAALEAEDPGGGMLPGAQEKRLWAAYKRRYAHLVAQLDDDFDSAFGSAFARAYEQAINAGGRR